MRKLLHPSRRREKNLNGKRSVRYLFAGDKKRKGQDKRRVEKKTASSAMSEKLNYAFESTIIHSSFQNRKNVDTPRLQKLIMPVN